MTPHERRLVRAAVKQWAGVKTWITRQWVSEMHEQAPTLCRALDALEASTKKKTPAATRKARGK